MPVLVITLGGQSLERFEGLALRPRIGSEPPFEVRAAPTRRAAQGMNESWNESCVQLHDLGPRVHPSIEIFVLSLAPRSRAAHRCEASAQLCRSSASPS